MRKAPSAIRLLNYGYFKTAFDEVAAGNREAAAAALGKALAYYEKKKDTANVISTHINIGDVYRGEPFSESNAIESYKAALDLIPAQPPSKVLVSTLEKAGKVWAESEDAEERQAAANYFERAALAYEALGQKEETAARYRDAGGIFVRLDDEASEGAAKDAFDKALKVYKVPRDSDKLAAENIAIGALYESALEKEDSEDDEEPAMSNSADPQRKVTKLTEEQRERMLQKNRHEERLRWTASKYYSQAYEIEVAQNDYASAAEAAAHVGSILADSADLKWKLMAEEWFRSAAKHYQRIDNKEEQVNKLILAGDVFRQAEDRSLWPRAKKQYEDAVSVYHDAGDPFEEAATLRSIANSYDLSDDPAQKQFAVDYFRRAAAVSHNNSDESNEASALISAGNAMVAIPGEESQRQAMELYDLAVRVYDRNPSAQINTLIRIGRSFLKSDSTDVAKATPFFERAISVGGATAGQEGAAWANLDIGNAYQVERKYDLGIKYINQSLSIYQALKNQLGEGLALFRLSVVTNLQASTRAEAADFRERSLAILRDAVPAVEGAAKDKRLVAEGYAALGTIYRRKRMYADSVKNYTKAYDLLESMPDQKARARAIRSQLNLAKKDLQREPKKKP
jgi:tetratricopeptide (TPR) repeat protein